MYSLNQKLDQNNYKYHLFKARESVIVNRIEKIKKTILRLQEGIDSYNMDINLKRKFESKIAEESETALQLVHQLKDFRAKNQKHSIS